LTPPKEKRTVSGWKLNSEFIQAGARQEVCIQILGLNKVLKKSLYAGRSKSWAQRATRIAALEDSFAMIFDSHSSNLHGKPLKC